MSTSLVTPAPSAPGRHRAHRRRTGRRRIVATALASAALLTGALVAGPAPAQATHVRPLADAQRYPGLGLGSQRPAVTYLQDRLNIWQTGVFREGTRQAVMAFERRHGLYVNGYVGNDVWRALGVTYHPASTASQQLAKVLDVAAAQAGKPYVYGAEGPDSFDCSGYVQYVYRVAIGKALPRTASTQKAYAIRVTTPRAGDLVFVTSGSAASHVAIYAGSGYWWESSRPGVPVGKHRAWTSNVTYGRVL
jgi:cell wall-associated NlpC family hydrolase